MFSLLLGSISCFISPRVLRLSTLATLSLLSALIGLCLLLYLSLLANKLTFRMNEMNYFVFYFSARPASLDSCDSVLVVCPYRPLSVALFVLFSE